MLDCLKTVCGEKSCKNLIILSDGHKSIESFIEKNNFQHFLCFRHFIESFGSNSFLGRIVTHLLYCYTEESFQQELSFAISEIQEYILFNTIEKTHLKRFAMYTGYLIKKDRLEPCNPELLNKLGLWYRKQLPTCTNHVESYHSKINSMVNGCSSLISGIFSINEYIHHKFGRLKKCAFRSISHDLQRIEKLSQKCNECCYECDCIDSMRLSEKYGIKFPCEHTYKEWKNRKMIPTTINVPEFSFKEIFNLHVKEFCIGDRILINRKKKSQPLQIIEVNNYDKYSRCGKNFMKAVYAVANKNNIGIAEAEHFCSMILFQKMNLTIEKLNHPIIYSKFFVRCWNDEESLKCAIKSLLK